MRVAILFTAALALGGCAVDGPLPEYPVTESVIEYTDALVNKTTSKNLDSFIDTTDDGSADGYQWYSGWWCPRHDLVGELRDVQREYNNLCEARSGTYDLALFCREKGEPDNVLFVAKIWATRECSGGPTVTISIVAPTAGVSNANYQAKLRDFGYKTEAEREQLALEANERQRRSDEEGRRKQAAREAAEQTELERRLATQQAMLDSLDLGTETHCGMVIDVRESLVEVQTEVAGNRWFKRGELFAPGYAPCKFYNGVYQNPF